MNKLLIRFYLPDKGEWLEVLAGDWLSFSEILSEMGIDYIKGVYYQEQDAFMDLNKDIRSIGVKNLMTFYLFM